MKTNLDSIGPFARIRNAKVFSSVYAAREFASILNRERDRSDRTAQEFSLVAFETGNGNRYSPLTRHLACTLVNRVRSTDDIGWLEDGRLGVSLPHTAPDAAWMFVDNVRQSFNGNGKAPDCMVYSYPSEWINTSGGAPPKSDGKTDIEKPAEILESQFLRGIPEWKRAIDIVGSLLAIIFLMPLFLLVVLFIKIVSPGPIFFRQERVGYLGKVFTIWKFRTMHVNADTSVHQNYLHDLINSDKSMVKLDNGKDSRIIPFGKILRAAGIDELPQLINVLLGDMSLVGPRPCLPYEAREYHPWQTRRFDTVPGLTGLWQVSGKNKTTFKEMMRFDIAYAKNRAFWLDVKIFLKTIPAIIDQVTDRPGYAHTRAKGLSIATRVGAVILAILTLNRFHK